jgi:hypothetical protein
MGANMDKRVIRDLKELASILKAVTREARKHRNNPKALPHFKRFQRVADKAIAAIESDISR